MLLVVSIVMQVAVVQPLDSTKLVHKNGSHPPAMTAVRTPRAPTIDGRLDEAAWATAVPATDFVMNKPTEGAPGSERTEVRILYDNDAVYVGAKMYERDPSKIRGLLTRRDGTDDADLFIVFFDSYHDHQTAFGFAVNPDGVRMDGIGPNDNGPDDLSWDPVWDVATARDADGWTAEMRIPLSQLRFARNDQQLWGVQFFRKMFSRNEEDGYPGWKNSENGYASRFGHLLGISGIPAPRRLEAMPYVRGQLASHRAEPGNPFFDGTRTTPAAGADLKYGVTSNLTFDATINPDFGQVESDPAELNLGVFETFQQERRPFFLEGFQIFDFRAGCSDFCFNNTPQLFYSRRIGRAPELSPTEAPLPPDSAILAGPFFDLPSSTPILGAAKLSGKLGSGTSLGVLHAETGEAFGRVYAEGDASSGVPPVVRYRDALEPRAHYSIVRLRQDLRAGATSVGMLATNVARNLSTPRLEDSFNSGATTVAFDLQHRFLKNRFRMDASLAFSDIRGSTTAISDAQQSSARYFQRRDQSYVKFDPSRTSLPGNSGHVAIKYNGPSGLIVGTTMEQVSPGFEVNDLGYLASADVRGLTMRLGWQRPKPGKHISYQGTDLVMNRLWNYGKVRLQTIYGYGGYTGLQSGWNGSFFLYYAPPSFDQTATRGGPLTVSLEATRLEGNVGSDSRKKIVVLTYGYIQRNSEARDQGNLGASITMKPASNLQLSLGPRYSFNNAFADYVRRQDDPTYATETFGERYVFAERSQRSLSLTTRANYTFSPSLSLQLYLEPFTSSAAYAHFKELRRPRNADYVDYGKENGSTIVGEADRNVCGGSSVPRGHVPCYTVDPDGSGPASSFSFSNPDRAYRSLRGTSVLRWEYRPGATFFAVWTQNRSASLSAADFGGMNDVSGLFNLPLENVFLIKVNYWFSR